MGRLRRAIESSRDRVVVYQDVLGEGTEGWDDNPLSDRRGTNCILWLYSVLSEAYASANAGSGKLMKFFRYFEETPAYGLRKHYTEHWLRVDPGPFRKADVDCGRPQLTRVLINPNRLRRANGYRCPFYRDAVRRFRIPYVSPKHVSQCASRLPEGIFVVFMVPSARYLAKYARKSGPMGLVHALILESVRTGPAGAVARKSRVHHASVVASRVITEDLDDYLERTKGLFSGFSIYTLDPRWEIPPPSALSNEARKILECEKRLVKLGVRRRRSP